MEHTTLWLLKGEVLGATELDVSEEFPYLISQARSMAKLVEGAINSSYKTVIWQ